MSVDASRIMYIPHVGRHLLLIISFGLAVPGLAGGFPALLLIWLVLVFQGFTAAWQTALVLVCLGLAIGLVMAGSWIYKDLDEIRWIDLQPLGEPTLVVFKKIRGSDSVSVAHLRSVHIVEKFRLGRSIGCDIWFTTADGRRFRCPKSVSSPLLVPAATLGGWFTERLGPAGVEVTSETVIERTHPPIEFWYERSQVAALWGVPIEDVDELVARLEVPRQEFTPRIGAMHGVNHTRRVFDPDDAHIVAAQVPAIRAEASRVPPAEITHREED